GERTGGARPGGGLVRLGLDLGLLQREGALRDRDLLLGLEAGLLGGAPGDGLGDVGLLLGAGGLGPAQVLQVGALGGDVLDLEGVQHQALAGEAGLGLLGDLAGEGGPVPDDVLHGPPAHDGAERAGQHFLGEPDDAVLLHQEPLGGGADRVLGAAHLDDGDTLQVGLHTAQRDRAPDGHRDVPAGEVQGELLLHERHDEDTAADHDLLTAVVGENAAGLGIGGLLAAAAGDDERLARTGDLVTGDDHEGQQDQEYDDSDHGDQYRAHVNVDPLSLPRGTANRICDGHLRTVGRDGGPTAARWVSARRGGRRRTWPTGPTPPRPRCRAPPAPRTWPPASAAARRDTPAPRRIP